MVFIRVELEGIRTVRQHSLNFIKASKLFSTSAFTRRKEDGTFRHTDQRTLDLSHRKTQSLEEKPSVDAKAVAVELEDDRLFRISQPPPRFSKSLRNNELWFDVGSLDVMERRVLQGLCKKFGLRAISKTTKLIQDLQDFHRLHLSDRTSILHYPFIPGVIFPPSTCHKFHQHSIYSDVDKASGLFSSLRASLSNSKREGEFRKLSKTTGARSSSSRTAASPLDSLVPNVELDKSFPELADTYEKSGITKIPSVTTILNSESSKSKAVMIMKWRKKKLEELGEEAFKKYLSDIRKRGITFHSFIKAFLSGNSIKMDNVQGCAESVSSVLKDISSVIATEKRVSHFSLGYSGYLDTLALYKGVPCVIEWKTSEKSKATLSDCHDFPLQVVAYAGAVNSSPYFSVPITTCAIVVAYADGTRADVHRMDMQTCDQYWQQWLVKLLNYKQSK